MRAACWLAFLFAVATSRASLTWDATERTITVGARELVGQVVFIANNNGPGSVRIREVGTSCDCAEPRLSKNVVAPGESISLHAIMRRRGGAAGADALLTVTYSDGTTTALTVRLKALDALNITPAFVWWKEGDRLEPRELVLEPAEGGPLIDRLECAASQAGFQITTERIGGSRRWRIRVTPDSTEASRLATFTIVAHAPDVPPRRTHAYAKIASGR